MRNISRYKRLFVIIISKYFAFLKLPRLFIPYRTERNTARGGQPSISRHTHTHTHTHTYTHAHTHTRTQLASLQRPFEANWSEAKYEVPDCGVRGEQLAFINTVESETVPPPPPPKKKINEPERVFFLLVVSSWPEWMSNVRCVFRHSVWLLAGTPCWERSLSPGRAAEQQNPRCWRTGVSVFDPPTRARSVIRPRWQSWVPFKTKRQIAPKKTTLDNLNVDIVRPGGKKILCVRCQTFF